MKKVLIVCGTGIATSTLVARKLEEGLRKRGIEIETRQCKAAEVEGRLDGIDLIVTTTPLPDNLGVPVIRTLAFLTGVGEEEVLEEVAKKLREGGEN